MAEAVVVSDHLTDQMIDAGAEITRKLDASGWPVAVAMWFYFSEEERWKLVFASPGVAEEGPREAYRRIQAALDALPPTAPRVRLEDVFVTGLSHPLITLMNSRSFAEAANLSAEGRPRLSRVRYRESAFNGTYIDDALIYRLDPEMA